MSDDVSTHSVFYPCPCGGEDPRCDGWDSDACECYASGDHDLGQEVRDV